MGLKIAVTGRMRSGKDTFAAVAMDKVPGIRNLYFAKGIESVIQSLFPEVWYAKEKPRKHYQHIGQEMRKLNPDVWVKWLANEYLMEATYKGGVDFIVTDLRQPNEAKWLKANGFTIVKIAAEQETRIARMQASGDAFTLESLNHETERNVDKLPYDYLIENNGTEEEFISKSIEVLKSLGAIK